MRETLLSLEVPADEPVDAQSNDRALCTPHKPCAGQRYLAVRDLLSQGAGLLECRQVVALGLPD
jgi:hypothetical protein